MLSELLLAYFLEIKGQSWKWEYNLTSFLSCSAMVNVSELFQVKNELPSTFKAYRYQQHRWSCGPANLFKKMVVEIMRNKASFYYSSDMLHPLLDFLHAYNHLAYVLQKVSLWKKLYLIYSFFFVRKIVAHIVTFVFYCVVLPATVLVPEVTVPKWGAIYIPSTITLLNAVGTPRFFLLPFCSFDVCIPQSFPPIFIC